MRSKRSTPRMKKVMATLFASAAAVALTSCSGGGSGGGDDDTIKVAYGSDYVFLSPEVADQWWHKVAADFEAANPGKKVELIPIPGGFSDIVSKLNLLYRNPSTAPDVAEIPDENLAGWVASEYLLPLDDYLADAEFWKNYPDSIKKQNTIDGKVYAVNHGENTSGLWYNIPMFKKAGLPVPWQPKTWDDVTAAAEKIKQTSPEAWPVWLTGGTSGGTSAMQFGPANLVAGSSTPTIFDEETQKWVVDSPGLREVMAFYVNLAKNGLQSPSAQLLDPNNVVNSFQLLADQKAAISFSGNYLGPTWTKEVCAPCFPEASEVWATAPLPSIHGTANPNIATVMGGWDLTISADSSKPDLAWKFIEAAQTAENMIGFANGTGTVPPDKTLWSDQRFSEAAAPYNEFFASLLPAAKPLPSLPDFPVWATGFGMATGQIVQDPSTTVDAAIQTMKDYITGQLGADKVETLS